MHHLIKKQTRSLESYLEITIIFVVAILLNNLLFSQEGFLKIECRQSGLIVTLNDSIIGTTPTAILKIKSDTYQVSVLNPHRGIWKQNDWTQQIQILPGDTTVVNPIFVRQLIIRSKPFDAQVFIENQFVGNTPLYLDLPLSKNGMLLIKKECYKPLLVNPATIASSSLLVTLEPYNDLHRSLTLNKKLKEKKFNRNKKLTYSSLALTISSGFIAAYLKNQAELKYEQYLTAGNLQDMNRYYNDSKRLDKFSSISLGIFEASFLLSFYFLIKTVEH